MKNGEENNDNSIIFSYKFRHKKIMHPIANLKKFNEKTKNLIIISWIRKLFCTEHLNPCMKSMCYAITDNLIFRFSNVKNKVVKYFDRLATLNDIHVQHPIPMVREAIFS